MFSAVAVYPVPIAKRKGWGDEIDQVIVEKQAADSTASRMITVPIEVDLRTRFSRKPVGHIRRGEALIHPESAA